MKRNMTKLQVLFSMILIIALACLLTACGNDGQEMTGDNQETTTSEQETADSLLDIEDQEQDTSNPADDMYTPPALEEGVTYFADIEIQDYGTITVQLDQEAAPITVANFVDLAESGFYDGLTFHRIMEGFMMQGGDPEGNGLGGSENEIYGEFASNGFDNSISHTRGTISMARAQNPNSASSQFFICHVDCDFLDGGYAAFGTVTEGMDVVDAVCEASEPIDENGTIPAENQPVMTSVKIRTE